ncbi:MAG: hypothetical protein JXA90_08250, partial [Planctomycetes bacterium]|nr:hypothetical protein [Planctomycetota bacterium]
AVSGSWIAPLCVDVTGYEVYRDGELLETLGPEARSFTDTLSRRVGVYEVIPLLGGGEPACAALRCTAVREDLDFEVPLRLNMGGDQVVDSLGRTWIGDPGAVVDVLGIRPDDRGGANAIESWCDRLVVSHYDSLQSLGLDPFHPADLHIFGSIRWDTGDDDGDGLAGELADLDGSDVDFVLELPVPDGEYTVNLYMLECGYLGRHFQIEIQDDLLVEDVNLADYSRSGESGETGRFSFEDILVSDGILRIALRPCPDCPGVSNYDTLVSAIEVLPLSAEIARCPRDLSCSVGLDGVVRGLWMAPEGVSVSSYELWRNGERIGALSGDATEFLDEPEEEGLRANVYEVVPVLAGADPCPDLRMHCQVVDLLRSFEAPVRINMGGYGILDSRGNVWLADPGSGADILGIRPDDLGGIYAQEYWSRPAYQRDSVVAFGFDASHQGDEYLLNTIRWDVGDDDGDGLAGETADTTGGDIDFRLEIPLPSGEYTVNLYFNEGCCPGRHFMIEIQDELLDEDVSYLDYDPDAPALGKVGRFSYPGIEVADGMLRISLPPCPDCPIPPGVARDNNPLIAGLEILSGGAGAPLLVRGDPDSSGVINITDGIRILSYLFTGGAALECADAGDTDDDGALTITDAIKVFGYLFLGQGEPAAPAPSNATYAASDCGVDTGDTLGCGVPSETCGGKGLQP